jgi:superfamily II DNA helicase RecQ
VVVSPLKAISRDQVAKLVERGVEAAVYDGELDRASKRAVLQRVCIGNRACMKVLYTTPETLLASKSLKRSLTALSHGGELQRIVFDEAHCVASWGNSFRCGSLYSLKRIYSM